MTEPLRLGLLGCGAMGAIIAQATQKTPHVELIAAYDPIPALARDLVGASGARADVDGLLTTPGLEAVYVATPHHLHAPLTLRALDAGLHVLVEKPAALRLSDLDEMIEAAARARRALSAAFPLRHREEALFVKQRLFDEALLGRLIGVEIRCLFNKPIGYWSAGYHGRAQTGWRRRWATSGGGILMMNAIHDLDLFLWASGRRLSHVSAVMETSTEGVEVEESARLSAQIEGGGLLSVTASSVWPGPPERRAIYTFEEGQLLWGSAASLRLKGEREAVPLAQLGGLLKAPRKDPVMVMLERYAALAREGGRSTAEGCGRPALEVVLDAYRVATNDCVRMGKSTRH